MEREEYQKQFMRGEKNASYLDGYHGRGEKPKAIGAIGTQKAMSWEKGKADKAAGKPETLPYPELKAYVVPIGPAGRRRTRKSKSRGKRKSRAQSRRRW